MAPERTVSRNRITGSGTAHRALRSELNDHYFKFRVSLPTLPPALPDQHPDACQRAHLAPTGAHVRRSDTIELWWGDTRERSQLEEERELARGEVREVGVELEAERGKGFLRRLFGG